MPRLTADRKHRIAFTLNGRPAGGEAEPRLLLSDFLRHEIGATGTHVGCEHGVCGACTIRLDGRPARACLVFAVQVDGAHVETVEGLAQADGRLSALQAAFRRHHSESACTGGGFWYTAPRGVGHASQAIIDRARSQRYCVFRYRADD